ncbi:MAG: tetratricopeptide repeat protein, partial [Magnetococcales bacterium]|nr:tetratricopeptide repeat protein [Magnetococcales bacterium]
MSKHNTTKAKDNKQLTIKAAYKQAIEHFNAQRYAEADKFCTAIIKAIPNHIDAINLLGVVAQNVNRHELAIEQFLKAIEIDNSRALLHYNLATSLYTLGQRDAAIKALKFALEKEPENSQVTNFLNFVLNNSIQKNDNGNREDVSQEALQQGISFHQSGRIDNAIKCYQKSLKYNPENSAAISNMGVALQTKGDFKQAIAYYQKALSINPNDAESNSNLGVALQELNQLDNAINSYKKAIAINPNFDDAYFNLGNILKTQGKLEQATASYQKAISINPSLADAHYNLGNVMRDQGVLDAAVNSYKKAIFIKADYAEALSNLGAILTEQGNVSEAVTCIQKAIYIKPAYAAAHNNLGITLRKQGRLDESAISLNKAIAYQPDFSDALHNLGNICQDQGNLAEAITYYKKAISIKPDYVESHSTLIFCIDQSSDVKTDHFQLERERWNNQHAKGLQNSWLPFKNIRDPERVIRIGYVGADFKHHSAASIFSSVLLYHDPNKFQIFCYAGNTEEDDLTELFKSKSTGWLSTTHINDATLANKIREDEIDILVDLAGHTKGNRLLTFARKPAPIQITAWGYPHGTKMAAMDYLFADPIFIPQSERKKYVEQIIDLPCVIHLNSNIHFPEITQLPASQNGYITFGAFNRVVKYNDEVYALWADILNRIATAKLLLKTGKHDSPKHLDKIRNIFQKHGVSPERIILMGNTAKQEHLKTHNQIDIMLDPFPHNGGMTTLESLRMGVPVLTFEKKS